MIHSEAIAGHLVPCTIRDYNPDDYDACAAVYASHVPGSFSQAVLDNCQDFLNEGTSYHLVLEHEGRIIGCAGLELRGEGPFAHLVFGAIHRDSEKRGFGTTLLAARLSLIEHEGQIITVHLEAAPQLAPFYAQFGFEFAGMGVNELGRMHSSGHLLLKIQPDEVEALRQSVAEAGVVMELADPVELPEELMEE